MKISKYTLHGAIASIALAIFYFLIVTIVQDFPHAINEFTRIWYLMLPLILGFGVQVGLFSYVYVSLKETAAASAAAATSTGMSTTSMIACCAHHLTDVLPLLGLSAAATFLSKYQDLFILLGTVSNLVGIAMMMEIIQTKNITPKDKIYAQFFKVNWAKVKNYVVVVSLVVLITATVIYMF